MIPNKKLLRISLILVFIYMNFSLAKRNYVLLLTSIKCTGNYDYVSNYSCSFDKSSKRQNLEFQMKKIVKDVRFDLLVLVKKSNNKRQTVYKGLDVEVCDFLHTNTTEPVLQMFKEILMDPKNIVPDYCSVTENDHMKLSNIVWNPEFLPIFLPEVEFVVYIIGKDLKTIFFNGELMGKVSRIRKARS
ncbi:uncharacterized protein LOC129917844 [Episyrphus balteatus]|uniref:uncharacterized protein LOC129917844 n=1 Tax=Episyrphus balteatus TaxID=286459 RepID=UPI002485337A|nr:uncharacterized protein LOC129917844 [Episyrphus balteatus]